MVMGGFATGIGAFQYRPHGPRRVVSNTCMTMEGYCKWFRDANRTVGLCRSSAWVAVTTIIAATARFMVLEFITLSLSDKYSCSGYETLWVILEKLGETRAVLKTANFHCYIQ
jgi:hypothetical protein